MAGKEQVTPLHKFPATGGKVGWAGWSPCAKRQTHWLVQNEGERPTWKLPHSAFHSARQSFSTRARNGCAKGGGAPPPRVLLNELQGAVGSAGAPGACTVRISQERKSNE